MVSNLNSFLEVNIALESKDLKVILTDDSMNIDVETNINDAKISQKIMNIID